MHYDEWRDRVVLCAANRPPKPGVPIDWYEQAIADIYELMDAAPNEKSHYKSIPEVELQSLAEVRTWELLTGQPPAWQPPVEEGPAALFRSIAIEARGLDAALFEERDKSAPDDPDTAYRVAGRELFIVPRTKLPGRTGTPHTQQTFDRRGFYYHRVLPREIGGATVSLRQAPRTLRRDPSELRVGGALFDKLKLTIENIGEAGFLVTGIECDDHAEQLRGHLDACIEGDHCVAAVWPELTLTQDSRNEVVAFLQSLITRPYKTRPGLVVLGSWHEPDDDGVMRNTTRIFDAYGEKLETYDKMMKFEVGGREEAIELGKRLPIILFDDLLIGFAICKDFCDKARDLPYLKLPIDLVVVPSYGDAKTMNHHLGSASGLRARQGAHAFIVQQAHKNPRKGRGWVAPMPDEPERERAGNLVKSAGWETYSRPGR